LFLFWLLFSYCWLLFLFWLLSSVLSNSLWNICIITLVLIRSIKPKSIMVILRSMYHTNSSRNWIQ
jgi:hypothetical protein